jgi:hypothetical protein
MGRLDEAGRRIRACSGVNRGTDLLIELECIGEMPQVGGIRLQPSPEFGLSGFVERIVKIGIDEGIRIFHGSPPSSLLRRSMQSRSWARIRCKVTRMEAPLPPSFSPI